MLINANMEMPHHAPTQFAMPKHGQIAPLAKISLKLLPAGLTKTLLINATGPELVAPQLSALIMKLIKKFQPHQLQLKLVLLGAQSTGPINALSLKFKT